MKRKASLVSNNIQKYESKTTLFTEIPKQKDAIKLTASNDLKVFGLSNLNPYKCVSYTSCN